MDVQRQQNFKTWDILFLNYFLSSQYFWNCCLIVIGVTSIYSNAFPVKMSFLLKSQSYHNILKIPYFSPPPSPLQEFSLPKVLYFAFLDNRTWNEHVKWLLSMRIVLKIYQCMYICMFIMYVYGCVCVCMYVCVCVWGGAGGMRVRTIYCKLAEKKYFIIDFM